MSQNEIILGYWDIRGLGQVTRLLAEYAGLPYVDKRYKAGPPPDYNRDIWLKEKFNLGLDFPNLPYIIDGDIKVSMSNACFRYLGRKAGLLGKNEKEQALCDLAAEITKDFRDVIVDIYYGFGLDDNSWEQKKKQIPQRTIASYPRKLFKVLERQNLACWRIFDFP